MQAAASSSAPAKDRWTLVQSTAASSSAPAKGRWALVQSTAASSSAPAKDRRALVQSTIDSYFVDLSKHAAVRLADLHPLLSDWTVAVQVASKQCARWSNSRGSGRLLRLDLLDESGWRMTAVAFNEHCHRFASVLHEGHWYRLARAEVIVADPRHSSADYDLLINIRTIVQPHC